MNREILEDIYNFSINNQYIDENLIIFISTELCKDYGWNEKEVCYYTTYFDRIEFCERTEINYNYTKAWQYTYKALYEHQDIYACATILFYKKYYNAIDKTCYAVNDQDILKEAINTLLSINKKSAFINFLIGKAYLLGRGVDIDYETSKVYFNKAYSEGIKISKLFICDIDKSYDELFNLACKLILNFPNNHIIKYYLCYCYFNGLGTNINYGKVIEYSTHTNECLASNNDPIDYYFLNTRLMLGKCYLYGYGVEKNESHANDLIRFAKIPGIFEKNTI